MKAGRSTRSAPSASGAKKACAGRNAAGSAAGYSVGSAERLRAEFPNHVWAVDFQFDETADYRRLKLANIVDEFARESLSMKVDRSIAADRLIEVLERLVVIHGEPVHLRMDNGPELISWDRPRLVPTEPHRDRLHRTGQPLGEPLRRVLQQPEPR